MRQLGHYLLDLGKEGWPGVERLGLMLFDELALSLAISLALGRGRGRTFVA